jgi:hypothetical protein
MKRLLIPALAVCIFISACTANTTLTSTSTPSVPVHREASATESVAPSVSPSRTPAPVVRQESATLSIETPIRLPTLPSTTPSSLVRESATESVDWKNLPIIPIADPSIRAIYEYGISRGNNPSAFSIFGDCQARPEEFFGVFETDEDVVEDLSPELHEVVANFDGSFNRESPTAQDGTTPGSLLWIQWHRGEYGCTFSETPVECELRINNPSFVIIQIGTHFESRNTDYLRRVITQLIDAGVVPILATKADNRELDERINRDMVMLASEYDLPLWNFWAAVSDLPNRGLYTRDDRPLQGDIYLTDEAAERHRMTGLEALNAVWRVATNPSR